MRTSRSTKENSTARCAGEPYEPSTGTEIGEQVSQWLASIVIEPRPNHTAFMPRLGDRSATRSVLLGLNACDAQLGQRQASMRALSAS